MRDLIYKDWIAIDETNNQIIVEKNKTVKNIEYFNSVIYQQFRDMKFKIINDDLIIIKVSAIMGNYSCVQYGNTEITDETKKMLSESGITLRNHNIKGKIDQFGREYVYSTTDFVKMQGKRYKKIRTFLTNIKDTTIKVGYHSDIDNIVDLWSKEHKSKHQIKLLNIIKKNLDMVNIVTVYYKDLIVGFSIVEKINDKNVIAIQRCINPQIKGIIKEPNFLLHGADCITNQHKIINLGASRDKGQDIAKRKLIPTDKLKIYRKVSNIKLTRDIFNQLK